MKKILVVAAHPDDEILGCGGTMAKLANKGNEIFTLILGEGVTSRDDKRDPANQKNNILKLQDQLHKANKTVKVKKVFTHSFPDNRFDTVALLDIVKVIEKVKKEIDPDIIFTHHDKDLNVDHQITYKAVITAARPLPGETVKEIYAFETLSSTEWGYPTKFSPDTFFDISDTVELKIKALGYYVSELRDFPHPRSLEGIELSSKVWGMKVGVECAEAFECVRRLVNQ